MREAVGPHYRDVTDIDIVAVRFPHPPATELTDPFALLLGSDPELGWRGHGGNLDLAPCLESDR